MVFVSGLGALSTCTVSPPAASGSCLKFKKYSSLYEKNKINIRLMYFVIVSTRLSTYRKAGLELGGAGFSFL